MEENDIKKQIEDVLLMVLDPDSPETLYSQAAKIEAYSYVAVKMQSEAEEKVAKMEEILRHAGSAIKNYTGTQTEKKALFEADNAKLFRFLDDAKNEFHYWYNVGKVIERKVILAQSILSNMSASIKAGIRIDN